jgi:hypothetical protein
MVDGGFPMGVIQTEMRAIGLSPPLPPNYQASQADELRNLWNGAGLEVVEAREITVSRSFADFDELLDNKPDGCGAGRNRS